MKAQAVMKARLVPLYFKSGFDEEFKVQVENLKTLLSDVAEILEPQAIGAKLPEADACVFPRLVGEAYRRIEELKKIKKPFIILTSEFGTVNMWDWEIVSFFKSEGLKTFTPHTLELAKNICRSFGVKREMKKTKFLIYQDNPGEGMQADIFKRFYWWEDRCTKLIKKRFGITIIKKSFKKLGDDAKHIHDREAEEIVEKRSIATEGVSRRALLSAIKIYLLLKREIEEDENIRGVGINCLNESFYSDTTPCLAWNLLFEDKGIIWACEADTMSLLTKYIVHRSLGAPIMMSNIYPFLMGMAALKHEKIDAFPKVEEPENHLLVAHCGYLGVVPRPFAKEWKLKPKVLAIVDENATAIDARLPEGPLTLAKLDPTLSKLQVVEGELEGYVQYPGSDCRNGAIIRVKNGYRLLESFYSHHNCLITGHRGYELKNMAGALDLEVEEL
jgi:hypothetical protein